MSLVGSAINLVAVPDKCRVCGCTETNPCLIGGGGGDPVETCSWLDFDHTLCSNIRCIAVTPLENLEELVWIRRNLEDSI